MWPHNPRPAKSLLVLFDEVNTRFPNRSKASDGMLGDAAHATRESDHNPWVKDGTTGVVTAADITDDSAPGVPEIADLIVQTLVARRDRRVKYIIHEGRIWRSYDKPGIPKWTPAPYTGSNLHFKHVHVSVWDDKNLYDDTSPWGILVTGPPPVPKPAPEPSLVSLDWTVFGSVNMHAPGADDIPRMRHAMKRIDHLDFTVTALQEFNGPMAGVVKATEKRALHRAEPNSGSSGNAIDWREPVWKGTPLPDLDIKIPGRWIHMAAVMMEHKRTGLLVPVMSLHNPASEGKSAEPQWVRDHCIQAELAWARKWRRDVGRAVLAGDWNERLPLRNKPHFDLMVAHKVDAEYVTGDLRVRDGNVHLGFASDGISDHPGISAAVNVRGRII